MTRSTLRAVTAASQGMSLTSGTEKRQNQSDRRVTSKRAPKMLDSLDLARTTKTQTNDIAAWLP